MLWRFSPLSFFPLFTVLNLTSLGFSSVIRQLGRQLNLRQRVMATAEVYCSRFFTRVSIYEVNIYMIVATCVYVACKTEEYPQHIRTVTSEARNVWPDFVTHDPTKIAECEFYLIEELDSYLIVYHPYRSLMQLTQAMTKYNPQLTLVMEELQNTWSMINDSYATDLLLLHPPHIIAATCLYMIMVLKSPLIRPSKPPDSVKARIELFAAFLGNSGIDLERIVENVQEMISLYMRWENFNETKYKNGFVKLLFGLSRE